MCCDEPDCCAGYCRPCEAQAKAGPAQGTAATPETLPQAFPCKTTTKFDPAMHQPAPLTRRAAALQVKASYKLGSLKDTVKKPRKPAAKKPVDGEAKPKATKPKAPKPAASAVVKKAKAPKAEVPHTLQA